MDPDATLRSKIVEFVGRGDFGLAYGQLPAEQAEGTAQAGRPDGGYERILFEESIDPADVTFETGVYLLLKGKAKTLKALPQPVPGGDAGLEPRPEPGPIPAKEPEPKPEPEPVPASATRTFRICGNVPPEVWNRLGTKVLPKLRSGSDLKIGIEFSVTIDGQLAQSFETDLTQIIEDLGLTGRVRLD